MYLIGSIFDQLAKETVTENRSYPSLASGTKCYQQPRRGNAGSTAAKRKAQPAVQAGLVMVSSTTL